MNDGRPCHKKHGLYVDEPGLEHRGLDVAPVERIEWDPAILVHGRRLVRQHPGRVFLRVQVAINGSAAL